MLETPFASWPSFSEDEVDIVARVIRSNRVNYWTGQEGREFETEFARWSGSKYAIALMNGTVALELALRALDIGPGDEVVVTPRTFIASVSCIVAVGASPVFADVDRDTQNITADTIAAVLTPRTRAVICVHLAGMPCDMDPILRLAEERGLKVIEDCAQAHGARYKGRPVGSIGHVGAWSFCQDKIMSTAGEGGMVTTDDEVLWNRMWSYKDHGKSFESVYGRAHPPGFRWLHESFGTNWRMLEVQSAVGRWQLKKLELWSKLRMQHAESIRAAALKTRALRVPPVPDWAWHANYKCYVFVEPERLEEGWSRDRIVAEINALGVPCYSGSCAEVYRERAFDARSFRPSKRLMVARELGETSLMFLVHPTLTNAQIERTCEAITTIMFNAASH